MVQIPHTDVPDGASRCELFLDGARALAEGAGPAALMTRVGDALARQSPVDVYTCHVLASHDGWFDLVASRGLEVASLGALERVDAAGLGEVGRRLGPVHVAHPLLDAGRTVGLVCFGARPPRPLDRGVRELTEAVAGLVSAALQRERAARAATSAEQRKEEFLATLAHELRNPLAPLRQAVRLARTRQGGDAQLDWSLRMIERQTGHMGRLLDELLDVSRLTRGRLQLQRERVTLRSVVEAAVETAQPLIEQRRHRLEVELPPEEPHVDADPLRLAEALTNLLTNAARFTPAGGRIGLHAVASADTVLIAVTDTGVGIAPERLTRVFETFSHAEPALHRTDGGLGIGLAIARGLVELHGGTLEAHSAGAGRGSEFVVRLPRVPAQAADGPAAAETQAGAACAAGPRRVVVADDNRDAAQSLSLLLSLSGYEVRTAHDGHEALEIAAGFRPTAAVLDIGMPRLNGYEVAARIRAEPWGRDVKLLAVTGWGQDEDRRRASEVGFDHHLTKPVDPDRVEALLAQPR